MRVQSSRGCRKPRPAAIEEASVGGPATGRPCASKRPSWQGQRYCRSGSLHRTRQPKWVHQSDRARTSPPLRVSSTGPIARSTSIRPPSGIVSRWTVAGAAASSRLEQPTACAAAAAYSPLPRRKSASRRFIALRLRRGPASPPRVRSPVRLSTTGTARASSSQPALSLGRGSAAGHNRWGGEAHHAPIHPPVLRCGASAPSSGQDRRR